MNSLSKKDLSAVLRYIRPYTGYVILSLLLAAVSVFASLYVPVLTGEAIDHMLGKGLVEFSPVLSILLRIGIVTLLSMAAQWLLSLCNNRIAYRVVRDMRQKAFDKLQILPLSYIDTHPYGDIVSRMVADVDQFSDGLLMGFTQLFTGVLTIAGTLGFMFTPDCAEYGQYKTGVDAKGITFSIQTFTTKIAAAIASSLGLAILTFFDWTKIEAESFADIEKLHIVQSATALNGLWVTYILVPSIGLAITSFIYLFYKLRDKDVQVMARYNAGEITREEAEAQLPKALKCGITPKLKETE